MDVLIIDGSTGERVRRPATPAEEARAGQVAPAHRPAEAERLADVAQARAFLAVANPSPAQQLEQLRRLTRLALGERRT